MRAALSTHGQAKEELTSTLRTARTLLSGLFAQAGHFDWSTAGWTHIEVLGGQRVSGQWDVVTGGALVPFPGKGPPEMGHISSPDSSDLINQDCALCRQ